MSLSLGKTLLVRLDRIGDLVLTLPIEESLRTIDAKSEIRWWLPAGLGFVADHAVPRKTYTELDLRFNWTTFTKLLADLRNDRPRLAIVYHAPWWVSLLLFLARIPIRAGPRSQWHQLLFLNRRIKQRRSRAEVSELEYNFRLTEAALQLGHGWLPRHSLRLQADPDILPKQFGLEAGKYFVVHPGMGGSALNWPLPLYAQLITRLTENHKVVMTGTSGDRKYIDPLRGLLSENANVIWLNEKLSGPELLSVLASASVVLAPSTGVLHLAASTGIPTLGLFSPVRVQTATRWGPQGDRTRTLSPAVTCPASYSCLGDKCRYFYCMQKVSVDEVRKTLESMATENSIVINASPQDPPEPLAEGTAFATIVSPVISPPEDQIEKPNANSNGHLTVANTEVSTDSLQTSSKPYSPGLPPRKSNP